MAGNILFEVIVRDPAAELSKAAEFGLDADTATALLAEEVRRVANLCVHASRAAVPYDTGELIEAIQKRTAGSGTGSEYSLSLHREVFIDPGIHSSSLTKLKVSNPVLADILNEGFARNVDINTDVFREKKRRKPSAARFKYLKGAKGSGPFPALANSGSLTANWVTNAQRSLMRTLG